MNQTDSMLDPTGSRRMRPAQTWWAGRSWRAQQAAMPVIGAAFRQGLNETGYIEGQNVTIDFILVPIGCL